jgi:hypothetical protein
VAGRATPLGDQREHQPGVEPRGVGRGQVGGDEHARLVGHGDAGLRLADQARDQPALDVAEVGHPLGHQTAHPGEDGDEGLHGCPHGRQQVVAGPQLLEHRRAHPLVTGEPGAGAQHLGRGPGCLVGLGGEAVGDGGGDLVVARHRGVVVGEGGAVEGVDRRLGHLGASQQDRAVGDAGHDGRTGQGARRRRGSRRGHGHKLLRRPP